MGEVIKLLLTVSGGLEDLVERQVDRHFSYVLLNKAWSKRTSGSQLYLDLRHDGSGDVADIIADAISTLDYVEYVYILLESFSIPDVGDGQNAERQTSDVLNLIHEASSRIAKPSIDFCTKICDLVHDQAENVDVGLGSLSGIFLPAPHVLGFDKSAHCANENCSSFAVNTIYTRKEVAKAVVDKVTTFIQQYDSNYIESEGLWIDAGSGDGSLMENLPQHRSIGVDTDPTSENVQCMDFLKVTRQWLHEKSPHSDVYVITNPPFSVASRGDYTPIVSFINHSFDAVGAKFVAVICPSKFARERIWMSLGLTEKAHLWARFLLPQDSFYEPATGKSVHIHSFCLLFGNQTMPSLSENLHEAAALKSGCYISAKRDKGSYRDISTAELTSSIVSGLRKTDVELVAEKQAKYMLNAKLLESSFELWWQVNPTKPCSSLNSNSAKILNHSMGWISLSVKPAVALAMSSLTMTDNSNTEHGCIAVNLMSGEGTIELEASRAIDAPIFMISGDLRYDSVLKTSQRISALKASGSCNPLIDLVVWDAQNLPLRKGCADAVLGDLPIQGTAKKAHQQPTVGKAGDATAGPSSTLKYSSVLSESCRILQPKGRAAFISVDYRSLGGACKKFNWSCLNHGASINLGGLNAKLFSMERNEASTKDLCLTVPPGWNDYSPWLFDLARKAFEQANADCLERKTTNPVTRVELLNTFTHPGGQYTRECYRFTFHDEVRNAGAKLLEKEIRRVVSENLLEGMSL
ncbi:hypothetical protein ACHAWO_003325 [Cyclotella atomus]|uniref:Site-specific DNA-methyltransferase (adenine-specific) n=1 Tax=Cyclotella atomus TaxID=382360 RepID=A0ABD3NSS0_9STRA